MIKTALWAGAAGLLGILLIGAAGLLVFEKAKRFPPQKQLALTLGTMSVVLGMYALVIVVLAIYQTS